MAIYILSTLASFFAYVAGGGDVEKNDRGF
jgi:hypothetical protein